MPSVDIAGRSLYYERTGQGAGAPPLLLIQGMSGHHGMWGRALLEPLEQRFDLVVYDHRGIGASAPTDGAFALAELAEDGIALLDALDLPDAHVMGISMGGMVAQELVLARPDRVRTLTIGCSYCGGPGSQLADPADFAVLAEAMQSGDIERALRASFEINVSPGFQTDAHYAAFREAAISVRAPLETIMLQLQAIAVFDVQARLGEIAVPTQVIHGTADRLLPYPNGPLIAERIPGARLETYDGVGHLFWLEDPERTVRLLTTHAGV
jgi:pimeloyl-ACP methyl ester carboxylesterase